MIARMWRGWVRTDRIAEYVDIVLRTGMSDYRQTPGNEGAQLLTRDLGDGRTELVTLSWWSDIDRVRAFAGDDIERARYYPEDDAYLLDRENTVAHFEVASPQLSQVPTPPGQDLRDGDKGFIVTRTVNGSAEDVFAHFTGADKFSRWFVVTGYRTPASRIALDPRPGGQVTGVLVSEETGTEIPFVARYGSIDAPRLLQFVFADPPEVVTITLRPRADGRTELHYRNEGVSPDEQDHAIASVNHMLDALQSCIPD